MSFFNWFSSKRPPVKPPAPALHEAGGHREKLMPLGAAHAHHAELPMPQRMAPLDVAKGDPADIRQRRHARREQLYLIIRESMTRMGVLSASYSFKVLSVDPQGIEFMVMMDMDVEAAQAAHLIEQFHEMEMLMIQSALSRFEITVSAVYWRTAAGRRASDVSASAASTGSAAARSKPGVSPFASDAAAALQASPFRPSGYQGLAPSAATASTAGAFRKAPAAPRFDPIAADEFTAFKQAMQAASGQSSTDNSQPRTPKERGKAMVSSLTSRQSRKTLPSYTLLTGFEETQMPDPGSHPDLSRTQYGDLH